MYLDVAPSEIILERIYLDVAPSEVIATVNLSKDEN